MGASLGEVCSYKETMLKKKKNEKKCLESLLGRKLF
jgi:hypothetical protein